MKDQILKLPLLALAVVCTFTSCRQSDEVEDPKVMITDFKAEELVKMHGGSEKSWRLTEVILPDEYRDYPSVLTADCVLDDVYTFKASESHASLENVRIDLGENRCFESISDAENFEAQLMYVPYTFNGETVIETTLILEYSRITYDNGNPSTVTSIDAYRLSELTEDRMVFSTGAAYVGDYPFAYVFESL